MHKNYTKNTLHKLFRIKFCVMLHMILLEKYTNNSKAWLMLQRQNTEGTTRINFKKGKFVGLQDQKV